MADWIVTPPRDPLSFPTVQHRHANGDMAAVRDRTPSVRQELGARRSEVWTWVCPCGETWTWERRAGY